MRALVCVSLLVLASCATASERTGSGQDRSEISREEIDRSGHRNALEMVQAERPHWLRQRGRNSLTYDGAIVVYLDGVRVGGPDFLAQVHPVDIERIRYLDPREAQYRFGVGHTYGALNIITRR